MTAIKIFLFFMILSFFAPFFIVSCSPQDRGVAFSGLEFSTGKDINGEWIDGNLFGFILLVSPVVLLILSFLIHKIKNTVFKNIYKYLFFILPVFDIFVVFIIKYAFELTAQNKLGEIPVLIDIKFGFWFYIIFNVAVFIFAVMNYFVKRE